MKKDHLLIAGAVLIVVLALTFIFRTATAPKETVRDPIKNPPKELQAGGAFATEGAGR